MHFCWKWMLASLIVGLNCLPFCWSSGWLRFCASGRTFRANPNQCSAGYWLKKVTMPQCICAHGIWILSKGYCDPNYAIVVGKEGTCFALNAEVRWIRMLGFPNDPFSSFYFVTNRQFDQVETASLSGSRKLVARSVYFGAINPRKAIQNVERTSCVRPRKIFVNSSSELNGNELSVDDITETAPDTLNFVPLDGIEKPWSVQPIDVCDSASSDHSFVYGVKPNYFYQNMEAVDAKSIHNTCNSTCIEGYEFDPHESSSTTPDESEQITDMSVQPVCLQWNRTWDSIPNMTDLEIAEQTKRLALTQINFVFFKHKAPEVDLHEYSMLQKARRIMEKVCPNEEVPPLFLRGLLRMFRQALNESHRTYEYLMEGDNIENERILDSLKKCEEDSDPKAMEFVYNMTCPKKFKSVSYTFNSDGEFKKTVSSYVPSSLRFSSSNHDLIVEAAWKVALFSHYFCARHFANSSFDHSRYLEKISHFFNRQIQSRWLNPGRSYEVMKYLFRTQDLNRATLGIDRCVGVARSISPYRQWMDRPKFESDCNSKHEEGSSWKLNSRMAWNGTAYCLKNWKDPMNIIPGYKSQASRSCRNNGFTGIS